jgi:hypothetical protein
VVRANTLSGISAAAMNVSAETGGPPVCAGVHLASTAELPSSGVVVEQNVFECPPKGQQNSSGYSIGPCQDCVERV